MDKATSSSTDREPARKHLELANKHVAEGQKRIEAQLALVARLARDGHDTVQAQSLLQQFEETLALQIETRERIIDELGGAEKIASRRTES
jgi:hypothetical protein